MRKASHCLRVWPVNLRSEEKAWPEATLAIPRLPRSDSFPILLQRKSAPAFIGRGTKRAGEATDLSNSWDESIISSRYEGIESSQAQSNPFLTGIPTSCTAQ